MTTPTTWDDIRWPECQRREYESGGRFPGVGRSYTWILCPFCGDRVKAYLWSLAGCGKRCACGALFSAHGEAFKIDAPPETSN